jgi:hypothetical protein
MLTQQKIFDLYSPYGIVQGGELYLPLTQALNFLESCQRSNLAVIGIEGFIWQNHQEIIPQLDAIADFSSVASPDWKTYQATCNQAAQSFLKDKNNNKETLLFNFVVQSQLEWEN